MTHPCALPCGPVWRPSGRPRVAPPQSRFITPEGIAPTHPHPPATAATGPQIGLITASMCPKNLQRVWNAFLDVKCGPPPMPTLDDARAGLHGQGKTFGDGGDRSNPSMEPRLAVCWAAHGGPKAGLRRARALRTRWNFFACKGRARC
ncbi:MAG: hypothetical protein CM15mP18_4480 [Methanobacteriota archaeon]|nr:MAG: hypothetical protein CM15mP18_4480 [Euryarchaeota archaeon]